VLWIEWPSGCESRLASLGHCPDKAFARQGKPGVPSKAAENSSLTDQNTGGNPQTHTGHTAKRRAARGSAQSWPLIT